MEFPNTSGELLTTIVGSATAVTWYTPDLSTLFSGATIEAGASVTVNTAWAFSGNSASANITTSAADDGLKEGYIASVPLADLCAELGVAEVDVMAGKIAIIAYIRLNSTLAAHGMCGFYISSDVAQATFDGGGAGVRGSTTGTGNVTPDTVTDVLNGTSSGAGGVVGQWDALGFYLELPVPGRYVTCESISNHDSGTLDDRQRSVIVGSAFSPWDPLAVYRVGLYALTNAAGTYDVDFDIVWGVRSAVPDPPPLT